MAAFLGNLFKGFSTSFADTQDKKKKEKLERERMAKQDAQFQQQLALQREHLAESRAARGEEREDRLSQQAFMNKLLGRREDREDTAEGRAAAAEARVQEQHDLTVGIWRDPARRDAMIESKMAELKAPLLQLQRLEFDTGKMGDRYDREEAMGRVEQLAKENQNALTLAQTQAAQQNYRLTDSMAPIQEATAKLGLEYQKWKMRPDSLDREDALSQANIFATKIGTMQTIQGMMIANAREGRESLKLSRDELTNLSEMIISTAGVMPGDNPEQKMQAAQNYWTKAWGVASDMMDPQMIDSIGGTMAAGPDYTQFKQDTALVGTGITNGRQATPEELKSAMARTEAFAAKLATADEGLRTKTRERRTTTAAPTPAGKPATYKDWTTKNPGRWSDTQKPIELQEGDAGRLVFTKPELFEAAKRAFISKRPAGGEFTDPSQISRRQVDEWLVEELNKRKDIRGDTATRAAKLLQELIGTPLAPTKTETEPKDSFMFGPPMPSGGTSPITFESGPPP